MGKASRLPRQRECEACGEILYTSAKEMVEHVGLCRRARALGLVLPGLTLSGKISPHKALKKC